MMITISKLLINLSDKKTMRKRRNNDASNHCNEKAFYEPRIREHGFKRIEEESLPLLPIADDTAITKTHSNWEAAVKTKVDYLRENCFPIKVPPFDGRRFSDLWTTMTITNFSSLSQFFTDDGWQCTIHPYLHYRTDNIMSILEQLKALSLDQPDAAIVRDTIQSSKNSFLNVLFGKIIRQAVGVYKFDGAAIVICCWEYTMSTSGHHVLDCTWLVVF